MYCLSIRMRAWEAMRKATMQRLMTKPPEPMKDHLGGEGVGVLVVLNGEDGAVLPREIGDGKDPRRSSRAKRLFCSRE